MRKPILFLLAAALVSFPAAAPIAAFAAEKAARGGGKLRPAEQEAMRITCDHDADSEMCRQYRMMDAGLAPLPLHYSQPEEAAPATPESGAVATPEIAPPASTGEIALPREPEHPKKLVPAIEVGVACVVDKDSPWATVLCEDGRKLSILENSPPLKHYAPRTACSVPKPGESREQMLQRVKIADLIHMANTKTTRCFPAQFVHISRPNQSAPVTTSDAAVEEARGKGAVESPESFGAEAAGTAATRGPGAKTKRERGATSKSAR